MKTYEKKKTSNTELDSGNLEQKYDRRRVWSLWKQRTLCSLEMPWGIFLGEK
jgi:hypothetical protein